VSAFMGVVRTVGAATSIAVSATNASTETSLMLMSEILKEATTSNDNP